MRFVLTTNPALSVEKRFFGLLPLPSGNSRAHGPPRWLNRQLRVNLKEDLKRAVRRALFRRRGWR